MIRAAIWKGDGCWWVDVAREEHFRPALIMPIRVPSRHALVKASEGRAPTHAEAIALAHELIKKENEKQ